MIGRVVHERYSADLWSKQNCVPRACLVAAFTFSSFVWIHLGPYQSARLVLLMHHQASTSEPNNSSCRVLNSCAPTSDILHTASKQPRIWSYSDFTYALPGRKWEAHRLLLTAGRWFCCLCVFAFPPSPALALSKLACRPLWLRGDPGEWQEPKAPLLSTLTTNVENCLFSLTF